jgi:ATP-binding cassette subfamily F protein 3
MTHHISPDHATPQVYSLHAHFVSIVFASHLDMESIDALVEAVKDFRGGLIVVSHDQFFITNTCGELWVVGGGVVTRFRGDFDDYKKETLDSTAKRVADSVKALSQVNN